MAKFGERDQGDKQHGQDQMKPPQPLVQNEERLCSHTVHESGNPKPNRRPQGKRVVQFGDRHPGPFNDKTGDENGQQQGVHDRIVAAGFKTCRSYDPAPHQQAEQHGNRHQAGEIEDDAEGLVEPALEKDHIEQQIGEVGLHHN